MAFVDVPTFLEQIRAFYKENAPFLLEQSLSPASPEALASFETKCGHVLPEGYKSFLQHSDIAHPFIFNYDCLSLSRVENSWQIMSDLLDEGAFNDGRVAHHVKEGFGNWDGRYIKQVWWSKGWIPFAEDGCGNMYCIDCTPGPNGTIHQIMQMEIQDGQGPFISQYTSFEHYLTHHLTLLNEGKYEVEHEPEYNWGTVMIDPYM